MFVTSSKSWQKYFKLKIKGMKNVGTSRDMLMGLRESLAQIKNTKWFFKNVF